MQGLVTRNYWQILTGLILEVRVVSIGEEPGLQIEKKKFYYTYATPFRLYTRYGAIIMLRHVRVWLFSTDHSVKQHASRIDHKFQSLSYPFETNLSIRVSYTQ